MSGRLGPDALFPALEAAVATPGPDQVEAVVSHRWSGLTRFASSSIHQNVASEDTTITVRVAVDGQVGVASTNDASPDGARTATEKALAAARVSPPDPSFPGVAGPVAVPDAPDRFDEATASSGPAARAAAVGELVSRLAPGQGAAGFVATEASERVLLTSEGARAYGSTTRASASTVVTGPGGATGHAEDAAVSLGGIDPGDVGERAASICTAATDPGDAEPGVYEVVLLPSAVTTLLEFLAFTAFNGKAFNEGRSAFAGRLGEVVASTAVTIADDAVSPGAIGLPWDREGTPKQRVVLVDGGRASGVVHDRASGAQAGTPSTGHALPPPNTAGPIATSLVLEPGTASLDDLVAGVDRGLLVTRFWYTRIVNPKRTIVTGMTRDGTFHIEGGERARPVRNLRYNQSILEALVTCDGVGDILRTCSDELSDTRAPAIRLRAFLFSSTSDH